MTGQLAQRTRPADGHAGTLPPAGRLDFGDERFLTDPWRLYDWHAANEPVHWSPGIQAYFVFGTRLVRKALVSADFSAYHPFRTTRRAFGPSMLDSDGDLHQRWRGGVSPPFRPRMIAGYVPGLIEPVIEEVLGSLLKEQRDDLATRLARAVPMRVMCRLMGLPSQDAERLHEMLRPLVAYVDLAPVPLATVVEHRRKLQDYFDDVLASGIAEPGALLYLLRSGDEYGDGDVLNHSLLLLAAGTETTAAAIGNLLARVGASGLFAKLRDDPSMIPAVVAETLRHEPPLHFTLRFAARDLALEGVPVPAGSPVQLCLASCARDPDVYPDPHRWDPTREQKASMVFGAGQHSCLGMGLARAELETLLRVLTRKLSSLAAPGQAVPPPARGRTFRTVEGLRLTFTEAS